MDNKRKGNQVVTDTDRKEKIPHFVGKIIVQSREMQNADLE